MELDQKLLVTLLALKNALCSVEKKEDSKIDQRTLPKVLPANALSIEERKEILAKINQPEYADKSVPHIVPLLADEGIYLCSESTLYRIFKAEKQLCHRSATKVPRKVTKPKVLIATGPNQVYSWDITYLPTEIKGLYYYLYSVLDVFSRKIVGYQVFTEESSQNAAEMMKDICLREKIEPNQVTLHSDNGSSMKGATLLAALQTLNSLFIQ